MTHPSRSSCAIFAIFEVKQLTSDVRSGTWISRHSLKSINKISARYLADERCRTSLPHAEVIEPAHAGMGAVTSASFSFRDV